MLSVVRPPSAALPSLTRRRLADRNDRAAAFLAGMGRSTQAVSLLMAALQKISGTLIRLAEAQTSA